MSDNDLTDAQRAVLEAVRAEFPVSWAPYCDVGERIGQSEIDVLNVVLELRMTGAIPRLGAVFSEGFDATDETDRALALLLADIPSSEHPYEELHEMLEYQGIDQTREWVTQRIAAWIADGSIVSFGVQEA